MSYTFQFLTLPWILLATFLSPLLAQETYTLDQILAAHKKWRDSAINFRAIAEVDYFDGIYNEKPDKVHAHCDWIWTDSGKARYYQATVVNGTRTADQLYANNGTRQIYFEEPHGDSPTTPKKVSVTPGSGSGMKNVLLPFFGLWFTENESWLADQLQAGRGNLVGHEMVDGLNCPKLLISIDTEHAGRSFKSETHITLNPACGFMPWKVQDGNGSWKYSANSFQQIEPLGLWFPHTGETEISAEGKLVFRTSWTIPEIKLNQSFPKSLFEPKIPRGTRVFNVLAKKPNYFEGGSPGAWYGEIASSMDPSNGDRPSAVPAPGFWTAWQVPIFVGTSFLFLLIALWLRRRAALA